MGVCACANTFELDLGYFWGPSEEEEEETLAPGDVLGTSTISFRTNCKLLNKLIIMWLSFLPADYLTELSIVPFYGYGKYS